MPTPHPRPWHRGSLFGDGPRRPLDRNQRCRVRYLLNAHARANRLPAKQEKVGLALLKRLGTSGQCDPCHATLAADTGCSARTVQRATVTMHSLGLLSWQRRIVRDGHAVSQTSNAYILSPQAGNFPVLVSNRQTGRQTCLGIFIPRLTSDSHPEQRFPEATEAEVNDARAALAARQRQMEDRLLRNRRG